MTRTDETASSRTSSVFLRYDLPASLVVFLVALPLCLGIALASDAPPLAGLIAAIVGGVLAGALGGSPLQVSGPAAGLTVIVAGLVAEFGWKVTCAITVCAGLLQILFGMSRLGRAALAVSPMVVHAMLAGIGISIALQQLHVLLGGDSHSSAWENIAMLPEHLGHADAAGMAIGILVIAILVVWRWAPAPLRPVPGPLVAVVVATLAAALFAPNVPRIELGGSLLDALQLPSLPDGRWGAFAVGVITVALIASVESLLTALAVDRMAPGHRSNLDRELIGQGTANMVSGAVGGLPITGVIVRSSANVAAGAKTRASSIMHGVWILVFAVPFAGLIEMVPMTALAGLLIMVGLQLIKITHIATARRNGDIAIYVVTVAGVVLLNLLEGVLLGLALSIVMTMWRLAHTRLEAEHVGGNTWRVTITGMCTFLCLPRLHRTLESVPDGADVTVTLSAGYLDHATRDFIEGWQKQHENAGGTVTLIEGPRRLLAAPSSGRPGSLFITCTDPRLLPNSITGSDPGDLFIVRNIGNLVPAGRLDASIEAAITQAVGRLRVSSIVVCGHSGCTAMKALRDRTGDEHLRTWLMHAETTRAAYRDGDHRLARWAAVNGYDDVDQMAVVNVAVQAQIVAQHPLVRDLHRAGRLEVVGLFYDARNARVLRVDTGATQPSSEVKIVNYV